MVQPHDSTSSKVFDRDAQFRPICFEQILTAHIINSNIKGINIAGRDIFISQLADDTTLFLKDASQIPIALNIINEFSKASGLCLNINKCELLAIKNCDVCSICNITVKVEVKYLGLIITKNQKTRSTLNFTPIIQNTKKN